jgi:OOP family OmpA-OmpF porin
MHDYDDEAPGRLRSTLLLACILATGVVGGFAVRPVISRDDHSSAGVSSVVADARSDGAHEPATTSPAADSTEGTDTTERVDTSAAVDTTGAAGTTEAANTTDAPDTTDATDTTTAPDTTEVVDSTEPAVGTTGQPQPPFVLGADQSLVAATTESPDTTEAPATTEADTTTDAPEMTYAPMPASDPALSMALPTSSTPDTTVAPTVAPTVESTTPSSGIPYDTMPDGSPEPVVVTFGPDVITLTGAVPSAEAAAFLSGYAAANSQIPGLPLDNRLVVNAAVPIGVGVRVIELESPRFADGSAAISATHADQLDRVAGVMQSLPHLSVVVVGHADQRGSEASNLDLSQARADAVIAYLADRGVEGSRMSARAVGEADLLSTSDDVASLTLNRRTEFIFYGVLLTDPTTLGLDGSAGRG